MLIDHYVGQKPHTGSHLHRIQAGIGIGIAFNNHFVGHDGGSGTSACNHCAIGIAFVKGIVQNGAFNGANNPSLVAPGEKNARGLGDRLNWFELIGIIGGTGIEGLNTYCT